MFTVKCAHLSAPGLFYYNRCRPAGQHSGIKHRAIDVFTRALTRNIADLLNCCVAHRRSVAGARQGAGALGIDDDEVRSGDGAGLSATRVLGCGAPMAAPG